MDLFPHNRLAYERTIRLHKEGKNACIIHPTGTGKAVIIAQFIIDNPTKNHLVLAPGIHIQAEIEKHTDTSDLTFRTYPSIRSHQHVRSLQGYDFIYLDEFHRLGAEIWGRWVKEVIAINPQAKLIGTTATHIRFLDEQRDMAIEIFNNNIASRISLSQAFDEGILIAPKYVNALYSIDEEFRSLATKIISSDCHDKKIIASEFKKKVIDWERTAGIDLLLRRHIPSTRRKIIVFCQNIDEIESARTLILPALSAIFSAVIPLEVHSDQTDFVNRQILLDFQNESEIPKVLFTVDMVNEGLHGKDISVGILMRGTTSPNVFYQQIGRCFSIGQMEQPIIIDLVNNFRKVHIRMFKEDYEAEKFQHKELFPYSSCDKLFLQPDKSNLSNVRNVALGPSLIEFIDETQEIQDIFKTFTDRIANWEIYYSEANMFFNQFGHLYIAKKNRKLYNWIAKQREFYKESSLSSDKIQRLSAIGMDWSRNLEESWIRKYNRYMELVNDNLGNEPLFIRDRELTYWVKWQRIQYKAGKLNQTHFQLLSPYMSFGSSRNNLWLSKLKMFEKHKLVNGKFNLTAKDPIYKEIINVKAAYRNNTIPENILRALIDLGFPFDPGKRTWTESFNLVANFIKENGRFPTVHDNKSLGRWISHQRHLVHQGKMQQNYIDCLLKIGIIRSAELGPK